MLLSKIAENSDDKNSRSDQLAERLHTNNNNNDDGGESTTTNNLTRDIECDLYIKLVAVDAIVSMKSIWRMQV